MRTLLLASALFAGLFGSSAAVPVAAPAPDYGVCKSMWLFDTPCAEISSKIVQQIQAFSPETGCDECNYTLVSDTPASVKASHTSLDGIHTESINFTFSPKTTGGCFVSGQSTSLGFTILTDAGLNYCNLYNLMSASGLTSEPGFKEITNKWICMGFEFATCNTQPLMFKFLP